MCTPFDRVVDVEVDEPVEVTGPAVAAGVVAHLRFHEARGDGDDAVDVALVGDAGVVQQLDQLPEYVLGECVRLRRGREAWEVTLEEKLVACLVLDGKGNNRGQVLLHRGTRDHGEFHRSQPREQLPVAVGEHGVVEGVLRVEVLVQGRLAHPDGARQLMQGDSADPVFPSQLPRL